MSNEYLRQVIANYAVDNGPYSPVRQVQSILEPTLVNWGGQYILSIEASGSFAKGTAVRTGTDIDLFISLSSGTGDTLANIYNTLFNALTQNGHQPRRQNVSIGLRVGGAYDVDLVPAKRQSQYGNDHSLYSNKSNTWLKTNVSTHIGEVSNSGRTDEIRLIKIWRNRRGLNFPSFYLELLTIRALHGRKFGDLSANIVTVFEFMRDQMLTAKFIDPANTNNVVSDTIASAEKTLLLQQRKPRLQALGIVSSHEQLVTPRSSR